MLPSYRNCANQLTGFCMTATLALNGLTIELVKSSFLIFILPEHLAVSVLQMFDEDVSETVRKDDTW